MAERHLSDGGIFLEDSCVICKLGFHNEKPVKVTEKGMLSLISYSEKRGKPELHTYLTECVSKTPIGTVLVHQNCRRDFTDPKRGVRMCSNAEDQLPSSKRLRSSLLPFSWKDACMLCGGSVAINCRHPDRKHVKTVRTLPIRSKLLECCTKRGDSWAYEVQTRLQGCIDLVAAEAVYHAQCFSRFMLKKEKCSTLSTVKAQGRPEDAEMLQWFEMLCQWLESEAGAELYTLSELHAKMVEFSDDESEVYTIKRLKQKLQEHYKEFIFFSDIEGRSNVLCFRNMAKFIINEKWYSEKKADIDDEAERVVIAAAKIIKAEIREKNYDLKSYPTKEDIVNLDRGRQWIPNHLQTFLKTIVLSQLQQNSIGHSIVQSARRTVITPTLFGLGIEMDHVFGSRWLIDEMSRLGFSISYDEVNRYKQSVIQSESLDNLLTEYFPGTFTQWVADNVDHNVATLDGQGSLHGMGIIAISTPKDGTPLIAKSRVISRQQRTKVDELVKDKGVPIVQYIGPLERGLSSVIFKPTVELQVPYTLPSELYSDLLWHSGWIFSEAAKPRPNWSGFMQHIFSDNQLSKSEVLLLPIIDLNPSDETCVYSTLLYIQRQAERLHIPTPCITFDQPLWLKAVEIIKAKSMNTVCRLGGFHTMMSFMGSIGSMMKGSGLEEALETSYGPNTVTQMISGKAISRALRGHFLVEAALVNKLMNAVIPQAQNEDDDQGTSSDMLVAEMDTSTAGGEVMNSDLEDKLEVSEVEKVCELFQGIQNKSMPLSDIANSKELMKLESCLLKYKALLAEKSQTAKLWLQYIKYVETLKLFIRAERTGNWNLHLVAVGEMMNLFAATGHVNYAKSSRLYLQLMRELPTNYPWLYQCFTTQGFHTVRISSRYWAGLWTDLIIEQVMMRSIKSRGGLTRGRGVTETVRLQWIYSLHKCAGVHDAMTTITHLKHKTSEQHVELGASRSKRDFDDVRKIQEWFDQHEPFNLNEEKLRSLSSGLTAADGDGVNCDKTEQVGAKIHEYLNKVTVTEATIKRSHQVKSLDHLLPGIQVEKKKVSINPTLLFSRLIAIVQREEDMAPFLEYELTTIPTSLFKDNAMRKTDKSRLAQAFKQAVQPSERNTRAIHVLDGGAFLHRVKWKKHATYKEIAENYVSYVHTKYGSCCIVFDGYDQGPSIKDHEHLRRVQKKCADIQLAESMKASVDQQTFLSNMKNKSQFITLLSHYLKADGQIVNNSTGDADTMIVASALQFAVQGNTTTVVADDTDVLVLLMYHWKENMEDVYFQSEPKKSQKKGLFLWKIRDLVTKAGEVVIPHLLFVHAWSGCDTVSATFGQGKTSLLKKLKDSEELKQISLLMSDPHATAEQIGKAGIQVFISMYGGKCRDSLNGLRYAKFMEMVASSRTSIDPQKLPPTERAAYFHSLRVHLQVILWKKLVNDHDDLNPEQWGWKLDGTVFAPIMTDLAAAPESLLKFVRCQCKLSSKNPCGTNICSCRKNGLKCVTACGDCRGEGCKNAEEMVLDVDEESDN